MRLPPKNDNWGDRSVLNHNLTWDAVRQDHRAAFRGESAVKVKLPQGFRLYKFTDSSSLVRNGRISEFWFAYQPFVPQEAKGERAIAGAQPVDGGLQGFKRAVLGFSRLMLKEINVESLANFIKDYARVTAAVREDWNFHNRHGQTRLWEATLKSDVFAWWGPFAPQPRFSSLEAIHKSHQQAGSYWDPSTGAPRERAPLPAVPKTTEVLHYKTGNLLEVGRVRTLALPGGLTRQLYLPNLAPRHIAMTRNEEVTSVARAWLA